jgi:hypothetical protein
VLRCIETIFHVLLRHCKTPLHTQEFSLHASCSSAHQSSFVIRNVRLPIYVNLEAFEYGRPRIKGTRTAIRVSNVVFFHFIFFLCISSMSRSPFSQHSHCSTHSSSSRSLEQTAPLHVHANRAGADWLPLNLPIVDFINESVPVGADSALVPCASSSAPPSKIPQDALYHVFEAMELELGKCRLYVSSPLD